MRKTTTIDRLLIIFWIVISSLTITVYDSNSGTPFVPFPEWLSLYGALTNLIGFLKVSFTSPWPSVSESRGDNAFFWVYILIGNMIVITIVRLLAPTILTMEAYLLYYALITASTLLVLLVFRKDFKSYTIAWKKRHLST